MVRFENVGLRYGLGPEVLRDLNFYIEPNSFQFLTGPSGAGKTSLLRLLFLSLRPTRGLITLFGNDTMALGAQAALLAAGRDDVIVVGFDGSDDAIQSILKGELKATSLQPVAEMANQAAIQADEYIRTGSTGKDEKQSIDMVLLTPENACHYEQFAPNGSTDECAIAGARPENGQLTR